MGHHFDAALMWPSEVEAGEGRPHRRAALFLIEPATLSEVLTLKSIVSYSGRALLALLASSTVIISLAVNLTKGTHIVVRA